MLAQLDEAYSYGHLGADIAKLRPHSEKQVVLLPERARIRFPNFVLLNSHIGICNFGHRSQKEQNNEQAHKACHAEIDPLNVLYLLLIRSNVGVEEDSGGQERRDESANALNGLRQIQADLGVLGRAANGKERVGSGLEGCQSRANDEHAPAKATEGLLQSRRPEKQASHCQSGEPRHEGDAEAEAP
jgi:hypothetical protein